ncbi:MAG: hypothetical protein IT165_32065 [Bryobacterales bacterium]|nr:hypothetical protein [Bryobacterales bacterium]
MIELTLPHPHAAQAQVIREARRFNVCACGRRWGKTQLGIDRLVTRALSGAPAAWFSTSYKNLADTWRTVKETLRPVITAVNEQEHRLELVNRRGIVEMWSMDAADSVRGRRYGLVVIDEAAHAPDLEHAWQAVIRPMLSDLRGEAWFLSTPRGASNYFARLYDRGQDTQYPHWASWRMPTSTNPYIAAEEIAEAKQDLSELTFAQEYEAAFVTWAGAVFRRITDAITSDIPSAPEPEHAYVIGADWGRSNDFSVFAVIDATAGKLVELDRSRGLDYSMQRARLGALRERWNKAGVFAEQNSMGQPIIEQLRLDGIPVQPFTTTNTSKAAIIEGLALAFERGEIQIPDDPVLIGELQAFEAKSLPSGMTRYEAPAGMHDDCVIALPIAWEGARKAQRRTLTVFPFCETRRRNPWTNMSGDYESVPWPLRQM